MSTVIKKILLVIFLIPCFISGVLYASDYCYFIPPKGWDIADPKGISSRVKVCFLGKSSKGLLPSINLATEEVDISLKAYIDVVKKNNASDPNRRWRDLGKFTTSLGEGRLTEIEIKTEAGIARQVQLIVIEGKTAYILTACALKEEFSRYYKEFDATFHSLTMASDLTAVLSSEEKRSSLRKLFDAVQIDFKKKQAGGQTAEEVFQLSSFQETSWRPFQEKIISDFTEMGPYWQILLLRDFQTQLLTERTR